MYVSLRSKKIISGIALLINISVLIFLIYLNQFYNKEININIIIILISILPVTSLLVIYYSLQEDTFNIDITSDDLLFIGSETGMIDIEQKKIISKGRLGPGDIIGV